MSLLATDFNTKQCQTSTKYLTSVYFITNISAVAYNGKLSTTEYLVASYLYTPSIYSRSQRGI